MGSLGEWSVIEARCACNKEKRSMFQSSSIAGIVVYNRIRIGCFMGFLMGRHACCSCAGTRFDQRHIHQMFTEEPDLQFVGADYIAHHQVICAVITQFGSTSRQWPRLLNDDLVSVDQS